MSLRYNRILLKISGEALKGSQESGYQSSAIRRVVEEVAQAVTISRQGPLA